MKKAFNEYYTGLIVNREYLYVIINDKTDF